MNNHLRVLIFHYLDGGWLCKRVGTVRVRELNIIC